MNKFSWENFIYEKKALLGKVLNMKWSLSGEGNFPGKIIIFSFLFFCAFFFTSEAKNEEITINKVVTPNLFISAEKNYLLSPLGIAKEIFNSKRYLNSLYKVSVLIKNNPNWFIKIFPGKFLNSRTRNVVFFKFTKFHNFILRLIYAFYSFPP